MTKTMIIPFIALLCVVVKSVTGIEIGADVQEVIADAIFYVATAATLVYGIVKNHKEDKEKPVE